MGKTLHIQNNSLPCLFKVKHLLHLQTSCILFLCSVCLFFILWSWIFLSFKSFASIKTFLKFLNYTLFKNMHATNHSYMVIFCFLPLKHPSNLDHFLFPAGSSLLLLVFEEVNFHIEDDGMLLFVIVIHPQFCVPPSFQESFSLPSFFIDARCLLCCVCVCLFYLYLQHFHPAFLSKGDPTTLLQTISYVCTNIFVIQFLASSIACTVLSLMFVSEFPRLLTYTPTQVFAGICKWDRHTRCCKHAIWHTALAQRHVVQVQRPVPASWR